MPPATNCSSHRRRARPAAPGPAPPRPHVALLVETALGSGRDILRGIARYVRGHGPWALYHEPRNLEDSLPGWLRTWQGDGVIARIQNRRIAARVLEIGIPAVDVLGVAESSGALPLVHVDDEAIGRTGAAHLLERGFRRFAFFGIRGENWSSRRWTAFREAVGARGCRCDLHEVPRAAWQGGDWETLEDDLAAWLGRLAKPAGVMLCSDQLGPKILEACRRAGISVPEEIAVVGVDNDQPLCEICDPALSSVQAGHHQVGYQAAALLDRLMAAKRTGCAPTALPFPDAPVLVPPGGVITRQSSDALAIEDRAVARALRHIREHACDGIDVGQVVSAAAVSRSVLQRRFRDVLGHTILDELVEARLKRARQLLVETRLPLHEVAVRSGFNHQEYMGSVFRLKLGTTPARYRSSVRDH